MISNTVIERFRNRLDKEGNHGPEGDCWVLRGASLTLRPSMWVDGKPYKASHIALASVGSLRPSGMICCHSCDYGPCVNPGHLRWGTYSDNTNDARIRGRLLRRYEDNRLSSATSNQIDQILNSDESAVKLAECLNLSTDAVRKIRKLKGIKGVVGGLPSAHIRCYDAMIPFLDKDRNLTISCSELSRNMRIANPPVFRALKRLTIIGVVERIKSADGRVIYRVVGDRPIASAHCVRPT